MRESAEHWEYDGSFLGFMTIVDRSFREKQFPAVILSPETAVESLFLTEWVKTDPIRGEKIYRRLRQRVRPENFLFIQNGFYATLEGKERYLLDAIEIALQTKDLLENHLGHPSILALRKSIRTLLGENHALTGFVRFEYVGEVLFSKIAPKHYVMPYLCPHFAERYPQEKIMIYDETHEVLGIIDHGSIHLMENTTCPEFSEAGDEQAIQHQWKTFLQAVTIDERANYRAQRNHLPLRFRGNMTEFKT
ncbi:MAG: TIGR03915 family putative DNA repair protein [Enterococcus gilvus]|nr:TIGR03915 family putative DNA repair protein [Enterococcus gilvus]